MPPPPHAVWELVLVLGLGLLLGMGLLLAPAVLLAPLENGHHDDDDLGGCVGCNGARSCTADSVESLPAWACGDIGVRNSGGV